jgi:hypothetical protein
LDKNRAGDHDVANWPFAILPVWLVKNFNLCRGAPNFLSDMLGADAQAHQARGQTPQQGPPSSSLSGRGLCQAAPTLRSAR